MYFSELAFSVFCRGPAFGNQGSCSFSLVPRRLAIGKKSAWYPLFTHARAVPLHSTYNLLRYIS